MIIDFDKFRNDKADARLEAEFNNNPDFNAALQELRYHIEHTAGVAINELRFHEMQKCYMQLKSDFESAGAIIKESCCELEEGFTGRGCCFFLMDEITVYDVGKFGSLISGADNFQILPHTDGNIEFSIIFNHIARPIPKK